jgi:oligopeptide transport system ATP-binding protein
MDILLDVKDLQTSFFTHAGEVRAVDGVGFGVDVGDVVGVVGESGCGKSVTALSIMRLLQYPGRVVSGSIAFKGRDLVELPEREMRGVRGNEIGMIFQDPMTSLNPVLSIKQQMIESIMLHKQASKQEAIERGLELMKRVGIPAPEERMKQYPHQFSGGMRQRVMIAMALACEPQLLIADEPTTALDVTVQAQILELLRKLKVQSKMAVLLITHDLGVVAGFCKKVIVMYAGKIVEQGEIGEIFQNPRHPYTWGLLGAIPRLAENSKRKLVPIWGKPPDLLAPPPGCRFAPRCDYAMRICDFKSPPTYPISALHTAACWLLEPGAPVVVRPSFDCAEEA